LYIIGHTLPDGNGLDILKKLKELKKAEGVIIISAKNAIDDKIEGLKLGADDYLTKPFHLSELGARIESVIRRKHFDGNNIFSHQELKVDLQGKTIYVHDKEVLLGRKETELLLFLIANKNKIISKNAIAEHLSGDDADMLNNYDFIYAQIKNLKKKLAEAGSNDYIKTVYGLGYKFDSNETT
jgi:DNA-binding response OmpR family regulator